MSEPPPPITKQMKLESLGRIVDQLFPQLPALVATPQEDEEGPPLLTAEDIDEMVDQVRAKARKMPTRWNTEQCVDHRTSG